MELETQVPFLAPTPEGLFVDPERLDQSRTFAAYVSDLFRSSRYLQGLNYEAFHGLLYDLERVKGERRLLPLAQGIAEPAPARAPLWNRFRTTAGTAHYDFGPLPIAGEEGGTTEATITFDELVAAAWNQQIRFGLDAAEIRLRLKRGFRGTAAIAAPRPPVAGRDARLETLVRVERDLTPVEDPRTGRLDLKRCKCSFPQLPEGEAHRLLRKIPATKGTPGVQLNGTPIPPRPGVEIDLRALAGEGTAVAVTPEAEYLVARGGGYIALDPRNRRISVTDHPVNHTPVGPETGSIEIRTDRFTQCADILQGFSVTCRHIAVNGGTVSGEVLSEAGDIAVQGAVSAGRLVARDGAIRVQGLVSLGAHLESLRGEILLETAENATLIGRSVSAQRAVNCTVVGERVTLGTVRGCRIRALSVAIGAAEAAGDQGEATEILVPILEVADKRLRSIGLILEERQVRLAELERRLTELKGSSLLQAFLQAVKAKDEQTVALLRLHATPITGEIAERTKAAERLRAEVVEIGQRLAALQAEHARDVETLRQTQRCTLTTPPPEPLILKLYGGLDWPLRLERLAGDAAAYRNFLDLVAGLTAGLGTAKRRGCIRTLAEPCDLDHTALLKLYEAAGILGPAGAGDGTGAGGEAGTECRIHVISEEDFRCFLRERRWPPRRATIEVTVDGLFKGYVYDFSTAELSMFVPRAQTWRPAFETGERLKLVAAVFGQEMRYELIVTRIDERADHLLVLGGFVNIRSEEEDRLYQLKRRFEVMRKAGER